jgi:hypothetical protein
MAARARHAAVALLAIAFVAAAAWGASLVAGKVFPARAVAAPQDDRFAPRGLVLRRKPGVHHPQDAADCDAHGGVWRVTMGASGTPGCVMPNADAGQVCTDSGQCDGLCEAPDGTKEGARVPGRCTDRRPALGCRAIVVDGRAWTICHD